MSLTPEHDDLFKIAVGVKLELISKGHKAKIYRDTADGYTKWGISGTHTPSGAMFESRYMIIFYHGHVALRSGGSSGNDYEIGTYDYNDPQMVENILCSVQCPNHLLTLTLQIAFSDG